MRLDALPVLPGFPARACGRGPGLFALALALGTACAPDDKARDSAGTEGDGARADTGDDDSAAWLPPDLAGPWEATTTASAFTPAHGVALDVQAWYPTEPGATGDPAVYAGIVTADIVADAPAACGTGPRPVVVFSHGNAGINVQSWFFAEHLAARGWIVVAPSHTFNTFFDDDPSQKGAVTLRRPADVAATFDWLVDVAAAPGGPLEGCVDESAGYAVVGHSFGGFTAMAVASAVLTAETAESCAPGWLCADVAALFAAEPERAPADLRDPRAWAAVAWTPAAHELLAPTLGQGTVPALVMGGGRDTLTPVPTQVRPIWEDYGGPRGLGVLEDAGHYSFSNACELLPSYDDCSPPYTPPAEVHAIVNTVTTAFLDAQRGIEAAREALPPADSPLVWETAGGDLR